MSDRQTLILGSMPHKASPAQYLAAGPWCFAGREASFPDWEKQFQFAPEPLANVQALPAAARSAQYLAILAIGRLAPRLTENYHALPQVYWQTLLAPWTMDMARQLVERSIRMSAMVEAWKERLLRVRLLEPQWKFGFANEADFTLRGSLGMWFNYWLMSRLLENIWPDSWEKVYEKSDSMVHKPNEPEGNPGWKARMRELARAAQLNLLFPRLKGMSASQAIKFSLALNHSCEAADESQDLQKAFYFPDDLAQIKLPSDWPEIFWLAMPESIKKLWHPASIKKSGRSRLRIASIISYEDSTYRQKLAIWRARGNRLGYVQHGGNYGQVKTACDAPVVEYSNDVFFTWGWSRYQGYQGNFVPVPYPQLTRIADSWHGHNGKKLIFVGAEMALYGYRLDSRPTPMQFVAYRQAKADFLQTLAKECGDQNILSQTLYRPYFPIPSTLEDAVWLLSRFPELTLCRGALLPHILDCRLLVLDHHGTTLLEAMAADVPMVLYWDRASWPLCEECDKLLNMLHECGIWHPDPGSAARKIAKIWRDPLEWWYSTRVREARKIYCAQEARCSAHDVDKIWIRTLRNL